MTDSEPQYRVPYAVKEEMQTQVEKHAIQRRDPEMPIPLVSPCNIGP